MNNADLELKITNLIAEEKRLTHEIVSLLALADDRKIYLERGFATMFDWLTIHFKYSEGSANRRIQAARLLRAVPEAARKLESGSVNISTLSQVQTAIRREEKSRGHVLPLAEKRQLVAEIKGKSMHETERFIAATFPESAPRERIQQMNDKEAKLTLTVDQEFRELLEAAKHSLSTSENDAETLKTLKEALKAFIVASKAKCSVKKRSLLDRAGSQCQWVEQTTGRRCSSRHNLQVDHIIPKAAGGSDDPENLRMLCRPHNLLHARNCFGERKVKAHIAQNRMAEPVRSC